MRGRTAKRLVLNPFVSEAQRAACYAKKAAGEAGSWDCEEWSEATSKRKLPKRKAVRNLRKGLRAAAIAKGKKLPNVSKIDPTRTLGMRRAFAKKVADAFSQLRGQIVKYVGDEDYFGLTPVANSFVSNALMTEPPSDGMNAEADRRMDRAVWGTHSSQEVVTNAPYAFGTDPQRLQAFQDWLKIQLAKYIVGKSQQQLWDEYIKQGFQKGAGRSFDDVRQAALKQRRPDLFTKDEQQSVQDFYEGSKSEFLRSSFALPASQERVELLASRTFDELENVTADMANKMSRVLTDAMVQGQSPGDAASAMVDEVDISEQRANTIARTELIRAHAEGQLTSLEAMGMDKVGVQVEWSVAGPPFCSDLEGLPAKARKGLTCVCELCEDLEGVVLDIDEARGMLPRHPNCRCAFLPANVGEDEEDQKRGKEKDEALEESGTENTWTYTENETAPWYMNRPTWYKWPAFNAFCPTGPGGGVNPHCSPGGSGGPTHSSGLPIGYTVRGTHKGQTHTLEVTSSGFKVTHPGGVEKTYPSLSAAMTGVKLIGGASPATAKAGSGWQFFNIPKPAKGAATSTTPAPAAGHTPTSSKPADTIPYKDEHKWET